MNLDADHILGSPFTVVGLGSLVAPDVSSNAVRVRVTGLAATTIRWQAKIESELRG